jgi:hypothetical protein
MKKTVLPRALVFVLLIPLLLISLGGCNTRTTQPLEGTDRDLFLSQAEPLADNLFKSMNDHDYASFSADFDDAMLKALTEDEFNKMMSSYDPKIGKYVSRQVDLVEHADNYIAVNYKAKYENDDPVTVRVVFTDADPLKVSGLWFNSAKLREK